MSLIPSTSASNNSDNASLKIQSNTAVTTPTMINYTDDNEDRSESVTVQYTQQQGHLSSNNQQQQPPPKQRQKQQRHHTEKESRSLCKQLCLSYAILKHTEHPIHLNITSYNEKSYVGTILKQQGSKYICYTTMYLLYGR